MTAQPLTDVTTSPCCSVALKINDLRTSCDREAERYKPTVVETRSGQTQQQRQQSIVVMPLNAQSERSTEVEGETASSPVTRRQRERTRNYARHQLQKFGFGSFQVVAVVERDKVPDYKKHISHILSPQTSM